MKLLAAIGLIGLITISARAELTSHPVTGYTVTQSVTVPGSAEQTYDALTGEISGWWDHHFSEKPKSLRIEAWPGGKFVEEFDDQGNGALHATVILAQRPKLLRMDGPLGLTGRALDCVTTYELTSLGDSTTVKVTVQLDGQIDSEWANAVDGVWHHFLVEAFKPFVEKQSK
ncbi:MAG: SRPBCC domain-containing protein [bacterium]|nr:SRPBCC domain-containing protein [bacterium]